MKRLIAHWFLSIIRFTAFDERGVRLGAYPRAEPVEDDVVDIVSQ